MLPKLWIVSVFILRQDGENFRSDRDQETLKRVVLVVGGKSFFNGFQVHLRCAMASSEGCLVSA